MAHKGPTRKDTIERGGLRKNDQRLRSLSTKSTDPTMTDSSFKKGIRIRGGRRLDPLTEAEYCQFSRYIDCDGSGTCWIWTGAKDGRGYGTATFRRKRHRAHRLSYAIANGSWPGDLQVMHSCDTPACVNPLHLSLGTAKENSVDAAVKGRLRRKLTPDAVRDIRASYEAGQTIWQITKRYPVSASSIRAVIEGRTWRHVDG